jgi:hypothetical protein
MAFHSDDDDRIPAARHRISRIVTYEVPADDFNRIEQEASTVGSDMQFATFGLSAALTFTLALLTVPIASERTFDVFFMLMLGGYGMGAYCGMRAWKQRGYLRRFMQNIRAMQEGPLGEEGKEIKPAELANMPLEAAPQLIQPAAAAVVVEKATGEIQVDIKESIAAPAADAIAKNE